MQRFSAAPPKNLIPATKNLIAPAKT